MLSIEVDPGTGPTFYARTSVPILLQGAESGRDLDPRVEGSESDFTEPKDSCVVSRILQGARGVSQDPEVSTNNRLQGATGSTDPFNLDSHVYQWIGPESSLQSDWMVAGFDSPSLPTGSTTFRPRRKCAATPSSSNLTPIRPFLPAIHTSH